NEGININHDITDIKVVCSAITYTVGGTISGLSANGLVLQNNGVDNLSLTSGDTTFTFNTPVAAGSDYNVTVLTQPTGLTCTVSNGYGTNVNANVTNISIVCSATTYTISGTISNLTTTGLVLQNNESDDLAIPAGSTNFTFPTPVALGGGYNVTIAQQPLNSFCTVTNGTGTNVNANVNNVQLQCYTAGDAFGGGAIYQITDNTVYVISLTDVPSTNTLIAWSTVYTNSATTDDDGDLNTYIILAGNNFPAAEACRNYDSANHWFLPARAQYATIGTKAALTALYSKAATTGFIGFALNTGYYSSTQGNLILAFVRFFTPPTPPDSGEGLLNKVTSVPVRCIRAIPY
ncbi:MAG: hypothetical protein Q8M40_05165, partial [Legionella sp.]|nr:hypothetical protein [Legionella sp.]